MKKKKEGYQQGFTLVEMIVVLVILGILLAILVPGMIQWIGRAKNQQAFQECRAVVLSAQGLCSERYGKGEKLSSIPDDKAEILSLAGVQEGASIQLLRCNDADTEITYLLYRAADGTMIKYENNEYALFTDSLGEEATCNATMDAMNKPVAKTYSNRVDSGAVGVLNTGNVDSHATQATNLLAQQGIRLEEMNAVSWHWEKRSNGNIFLWTDQDIKTMHPDDPIAYIQYNAANGLYTVWISKVSTVTLNGVTYNTLTTNNNKEVTGSLDASEKTYTNALTLLKREQEKLSAAA